MEVISLPIEIDKEKMDGYFRLVLATVKRAKDLAQGAQPVTESKAQKVTIRALEEVLSDKVQILTGEAAVKAEEEAVKFVHKNIIDEAKQKEEMSEDMTELEKDLKVFMSERGERDSKKTIEDIFGED
ncbi:MAG: DNA-directed RNA polymerase subunit omega [Nitrospirota bacterium]